MKMEKWKVQKMVSILKDESDLLSKLNEEREIKGPVGFGSEVFLESDNFRVHDNRVWVTMERIEEVMDEVENLMGDMHYELNMIIGVAMNLRML